MRLACSTALLSLWWLSDPTVAFTQGWVKPSSIRSGSSDLHVSIGLGPEKKEEGEEKVELVAGVDYEIPDHESYRTSRRSKIDEQCDEWYGSLMGSEDDKGILGSLADDARKILLTPVPLVNDVCAKSI
jgi:hypothetical protein